MPIQKNRQIRAIIHLSLKVLAKIDWMNDSLKVSIALHCILREPGVNDSELNFCTEDNKIR